MILFHRFDENLFIMMKFFPFLFAFLGAYLAPAQQNQEQVRYIEEYKMLAVREMERSGIPASIKLAQGLLESNSGKSDVARHANNHFGIKCGEGWSGKKYHKKDDDYNDQGELTNSCFRVYRNVESSYIAHSDFLRDPKKIERYGFLFQLDPMDYKRWARGLRSAGYATGADYDQKLISLIEKYELFQYDRLKLDEVADRVEDLGKLTKLSINDVKYIVSQPGETLTDIANRADISAEVLKKYNEQLTNSPEPNTRIFIQPKRKSYRGRSTWHEVKQDENMYHIAQEYGVTLSDLYKRNRMSPGAEPEIGEAIKLRAGKVKKAPSIRKKVSPALPPKPMPKDTAVISAVEVIANTPPNPSSSSEKVEEQNEEEVLPEIVPDKLPEKVEPKPETTVVTPPISQPVEEKPIPSPPVTEDPPVVPAIATHEVASGDTLYNIARRYNISVEELKKWNQLKDNTIKIGMKLKVKQ